MQSKPIILFILCLFPLSIWAQSSAHMGAPKYLPVEGKLLIVGQDLGAVGGLSNYTSGYIDDVGYYPAGVTSYTSLSDLSGLASLANWGAGDVNAQQYLDDDNFQDVAIAIGLYMVGFEDIVAGGFRDNSIRQLGEWIKSANRPVFLRIGYEFDGPWNNYNPEDFVEAWRRIVHVFDELKVQNVAYVWQSAGINTRNIGRWYPGDEYVNWLAYSHFDSFNPGQSIRDFAAVHDKPIMIAECTPRVDLNTINGETAWRNWYSPLFQSIEDDENIKALAYINVDWDAQPMWNGQGWGDSRLSQNEYVFEQWSNEIANNNWLVSSDSLFDQLDYQLWQDSIVSIPLSLAPENFELSWEVVDQRMLISTHQNQYFQLRAYTVTGQNIPIVRENQSDHSIDLTHVKDQLLLLMVSAPDGTRKTLKLRIDE